MLSDKFLETTRIKFFSHVHLSSYIKSSKEFSVMVIILDNKILPCLKTAHAEMSKILFKY